MFFSENHSSGYCYRDMSFLTNEKQIKDFLPVLKLNLEFSNLINDVNINTADHKFNHCPQKSLNEFDPIG